MTISGINQLRPGLLEWSLMIFQVIFFLDASIVHLDCYQFKLNFLFSSLSKLAKKAACTDPKMLAKTRYKYLIAFWG